MTSNCPYCRRELDLMTVFQEGDQAAIIRLLPSFGRHANVVMGYCYQFGVSPQSLKAKKLRNLLTEIRTLFDSESFSYQKRRYRISQAGIAEALAVVEKRSFHAPLDNHNYLKRVMLDIAEREAKAAGRASEEALRDREARLMSGQREAESSSLKNEDPSPRYPVPEESVAPPPLRMKSMPAARLTDEQIEANRRRLKEMMNKIG